MLIVPYEEHFLGLAEEAEPNLIGVGSHAAWLDRLERDHDNFRVAVDWLEASGDSNGALRLTAALWRFWDGKGHLVEGRGRVESALHAAEHPTAARAKALSGAADMALTTGDIAAGGRWAREALELHRQLGDAWGSACLEGRTQGRTPRARGRSVGGGIVRATCLVRNDSRAIPSSMLGWARVSRGSGS